MFPILYQGVIACGVPVLATRVGAIPEIVVEEENGLLVPPGAPVALAKGMARLAEDRELRRKIGANNRGKAEREFSFAIYEERLGNIYAASL